MCVCIYIYEEHIQQKQRIKYEASDKLAMDNLNISILMKY